MIAITIVAVALPAAFLTSAVLFVSTGIAREESDRSLLFSPETRSSAITRRVVGLYVRTPRGAAPANARSWQLDSASDPRGIL